MNYLGIDTSNYTTSVAVFESESGKIISEKILLDSGDAVGLRQSEAHFLHTKNLPEIFNRLEFKGEISGVGVSNKPRAVEGSYMPCFLAGVSAASAVSSVLKLPLFSFSHQEGHIAAAIYSAGKTELFEKGAKFYAYHLSGGTTELLKVTSTGTGFESEIAFKTKDISAGQVLDRTGKMLGFKFPSGKEIDASALKSSSEKYLKCHKQDGFNFSGIENKVALMIKTEKKEDVSRYALLSVIKAISKSLEGITEPVIMSGGVSSSLLLREKIKGNNIYYAAPEFSCDNAVGIAILASRKTEER